MQTKLAESGTSSLKGLHAVSLQLEGSHLGLVEYSKFRVDGYGMGRIRTLDENTSLGLTGNDQAKESRAVMGWVRVRWYDGLQKIRKDAMALRKLLRFCWRESGRT